MPCQLILALDLPNRAVAAPVLRQVSGRVAWVKIGLQMFTAHGPDYVREVADQGFKVFLDLKLHDIPHTVARAVESLSVLPIGMLTLHASGGREMVAAAKKAAPSSLTLLGVTVLTSFDAAGLAETGVPGSPEEQVRRLARLAVEAGAGGLVCSPLEAAMLRALVPARIQLVIPGIRPAGTEHNDDQKRVLTPAGAAKAGADFIVVGRPILQSPDPAATAAAVLADLASA
jgi:orotidine-5'-phosphate decarboxylase